MIPTSLVDEDIWLSVSGSMNISQMPTKPDKRYCIDQIWHQSFLSLPILEIQNGISCIKMVTSVQKFESFFVPRIFKLANSQIQYFMAFIAVPTIALLEFPRKIHLKVFSYVASYCNFVFSGTCCTLYLSNFEGARRFWFCKIGLGSIGLGKRHCRHD